MVRGDPQVLECGGHQGAGQGGDVVQFVAVLGQGLAQSLVELDEVGGFLLGVGALPFGGQRP